MISGMCGTQSSQADRGREWQAGCQGLEGEGRGALVLDGGRVSVLQEEKTSGDEWLVFAQQRECTSCH